MITRPLLLSLLVLTCFLSFTASQKQKSRRLRSALRKRQSFYLQTKGAKGPEDCCFKFFLKPIPIRVIKSYVNTSSDCPKTGVIITTQNSKRVCVDPGYTWVRRIMDLIDQRAYESST